MFGVSLGCCGLNNNPSRTGWGLLS